MKNKEKNLIIILGVLCITLVIIAVVIVAKFYQNKTESNKQAESIKEQVSGITTDNATIGSMIRAYCLWQSNMKLVRISGITTGILYGSYYIYYHSWFMILGDLILLITGIIDVYKNDIKKIYKKEQMK